MKKIDKQLVSAIGEYYVLYQLARLGLYGHKLPDRFDYDLLVSNGYRIEVKCATATINKSAWKKLDGSNTEYERWQFSNHVSVLAKTEHGRRITYGKRNRHCDFFALVCLDNNTLEVERSYLVPKNRMTASINIAISKNGPSPLYDKFRDKWNALLISKESPREINHEPTQKASRHKLSRDDYEKVKKLRADGWKLAEIARLYHVNSGWVSKIVNEQVETKWN